MVSITYIIVIGFKYEKSKQNKIEILKSFFSY